MEQEELYTLFELSILDQIQKIGEEDDLSKANKTEKINLYMLLENSPDIKNVLEIGTDKLFWSVIILNSNYGITLYSHNKHNHKRHKIWNEENIEMDLIYIHNDFDPNELIKMKVMTRGTIIIYHNKVEHPNLHLIDSNEVQYMYEFEPDYYKIWKYENHKIPNIYHFICLKPLEFGLLHYLAIITTHFINIPYKIYVYVDEEPDTIYWHKIKKYITIEKVIPHKIFRGVEICYPQYQADILRLEILIERGGIYLDIDTLILKSMEELLDHESVLFANLKENGEIENITNGFLAFQPNDPFLKDWYDKIHKYLDSDTIWAYGAVVLPVNIYKENISKYKCIEIKDFNLYCPFDWNNYGAAFDLEKKDNNLYQDAYSIHMWQTMLQDDVINHFNIEFFKKYNNWFTNKFKKYVAMINYI